jgi:predicted alpha/beta-fold hydrolase
LLKVFKRFKQKLDLWAINASYSTLAPPQPDPTQINELHTILKSPDFFQPPDSAAKLHFFNKWQFAFDSSVSLCCPENNRVNGWFIPCGKDWRSRPLVLLLHGWNAEMHYEFILPRLGKRLRKRGMNTIAFELPLHSQRRPSASYRIRNFISDHLPTMLQATRQSLADIHSILLWAKKEGCPGVAVWGFSLGAWLADKGSWFLQPYSGSSRSCADWNGLFRSGKPAAFNLQRENYSSGGRLRYLRNPWKLRKICKRLGYY